MNRRLDVTGGGEEAVVGKILYELALEVNAPVGPKMHRLCVCEWEVKFRISSEGDADGAWRVVVQIVTAHTCIVHVSRFGMFCIYGYGMFFFLQNDQFCNSIYEMSMLP